MMNDKLIRFIRKIVGENDLECLLVGGAVRDDLLGKEPKDYDFVCNDSEKLINLIEKYVDDGVKLNVKKFKKYGTYQLRLFDEDVEFVNPRKEAYMTWSHKPECVPGTIKDDIMRRDFTINTLAYDMCFSQYPVYCDDVVDLTGRGMSDMISRTLDCVSDPIRTFTEDPSRLVRLCIYAAKGFEPTIEVINSASRVSGEIKRVPLDAVRQMMDKGIVIDGFMYWMYFLGILQDIMPEFTDLHTYKQPQKHHIHNVLDHTINAINFISPGNKTIRWSALFHDVGKGICWDEHGNFHGHEFESEKITRKILERMKFSSVDTRKILHLVRNHMAPTLTAVHNKPTKRSIGKFFRKHEDYLDELFILTKADIFASGVHIKGDLGKINEFYDKLSELKLRIGMSDNREKFTLNYTGNDIMDTLKIKPGVRVGEIKKILEDKVCAEELENDWNVLNEYVKNNLI